ncbi:MAG: hypothetical protein KC505_05490 [Myxococcales bacterium]|nr:hypothetical protein [Myxococcales bacterium]USN51873.1 MAG: hypothetical protein H6731_05560 [Myxococcales bacterium]
MKNLQTHRCILFIICLSAASLFSSSRLDLSEGSLYLRGAFSLDYQLSSLKNNENHIDLFSDIAGGFLVKDNFAFGLAIPIKWMLLPLGESDVGISVLSSYYFDIESPIFPYCGVNITPHYKFVSKEFLFYMALNLGILVTLSESVALDIGLAPKLHFPIGNRQGWKLEVPTGLIGVRAFF